MSVVNGILPGKSVLGAICKLFKLGCLLLSASLVVIASQTAFGICTKVGPARTVVAGSVGTSAVTVAAVTTSLLSTLCRFREGADAGRLCLVSADRFEPLPLSGVAEAVDRPHGK